ncbi:MAG: hypothetical protein HDT27_00010 [Subdoligranulum sp.]|nr:hypothetical protein [Subdoligranulum sp.]
MKNKTKAILRKFGVLLAVTLLFTALAVPAWAEGGNDNSDPPLPSETALSSGSLTVTGYTVMDSSGRELQRIEPGQKCRIIVAVVDSRIAPDNEEQKTTIAQNMGINVKVTSTSSFASPSLGDITTTTITPEKVTANGLEYGIILNDITYRGGENELALDISCSGYTYPLPLASIEQPISQCYDADTVEEPKDSALVLTSASYGGGSVEAGRDFTLTVDVLAPAKYAGAENVKVIITPPEQFTASSGSTMIYVGDLAPGASRQVTFELNASAVAPSGSYSINVSVSGTAASGAAPADQMSVTVPVTQPERFEISRTDLPEYLSMGEEGYAYVSFVNKGKGTIYNVSAEITGEGITTTEGNQYIGNVQSGSESSADFTIQTSQAGNISALLTITYEDEKGNIKELTQDFTITVEEMYMGGMDDFYPGDFGDIDVMPEENTGMPVWGWILIVLGVLAAGGGAAFFIIKKKKTKQKAAQLTEDDDEDI